MKTTKALTVIATSLIVLLTISFIAALVTFLISKNKKASIIIGLLVLSHTVLDIISSPKLAFYPTDTKMSIFFNDSLSVGLGMFKYKTIALIGEFGILITGLIIYILTIRKGKINKLSSINPVITNNLT